MLSFPPPSHGAANSWAKAQEKVVGCKWISTLISFHPSLFPSLCSTSLASYSAASSSAKSHPADLSDILRRGLPHVSSHICQLRLLREATPLNLTHTGLHNSRSPVLHAPWDSSSTTMAVQCLWIGLFPAFQSAGEGEWASPASAFRPYTQPHTRRHAPAQVASP